VHEGSNVRVAIVQLPALNTPQFEVVRSRLPRRAKPVPPIFQPELAARAVLLAADHPRREIWVAGSTVKAILANRVVPGLLDRYLARTGYDAQQAAEPIEPGRQDNLFAPLPGDRGAHGRFGAESRPGSLQFLAVRHRRGLAAAGAAAAVVALFRRG
jgi:hypothetical protein